MRRVLAIPMLISAVVPAHARPAARPVKQPVQASREAAKIVLERDARGTLRSAACARFDFADLGAFVSDDTVRAKRCAPKAPRAAGGKK
jgi:hypothetical protein